MTEVLPEARDDAAPSQLVARALGARPLRVTAQSLSESGKSVYRLDLADGRAAVLRMSARPNTFAFTRRNLEALRALRLPVQSVLASGATESGGSYIILNWLPGRDLVHELAAMSRAQMSRLAEQIVECQRRVGTLPRAAKFGWAPIGRSGNLEKWTQVFGDPASAELADDGTTLGALRARLCTLRSRVETYFGAVRPVPFLDDLSTKNVLLEDGKLSGIIDVDFVCYGDPLLSVGATMASLAGDLTDSEAFYGEELARFWNLDARQRLALWFYAALWATGSLQLTDAAALPVRAESLRRSASSWLSLAESQSD